MDYLLIKAVPVTVPLDRANSNYIDLENKSPHKKDTLTNIVYRIAGPNSDYRGKLERFMQKKY